MKIEREINLTFKEWKSRQKRKPILVKGARQIGKSWAMEEFGREYFKYVAKFDFDRRPELKSAFEYSKEPSRIIKELSMLSDVPLIPGDTLIIFDEIQECEEALNSLKYFCEDAPQWHIIAAGSLLGVAVKKKKMAVPVGKVEIVRMYPVSFREFLKASSPKIYDFVNGLQSPGHLSAPILNQLLTEYRRYMVCGGMPEATVAMLENQGTDSIEKILQNILDLYELDFAKYAEPREIPRIHAIWHSLPSQLSKENRKFIYKVVKEGARSKDYEDALLWLEDAGMIYRVNNISKPGMPISAYEDPSAFKVYACDCGLLRRLSRLSPNMIMNPSFNFTEFKGALAENAVLQALKSLLKEDTIYYWTSGGTAEIEFVVQHQDEIIPIEVKAENNVSGQSISVYNKKYSPLNRIRYSFLNLQQNGGLLSCPSPLVEWSFNWLIKNPDVLMTDDSPHPSLKNC